MAPPKNSPGPIRSAPKYAEFGSYDKLAKTLRTKFPDTPWPGQERSLGVKIGNLDKGQRVWWLNHPDNAKCLAELLEMPLADFGLHGPAITSHVSPRVTIVVASLEPKNTGAAKKEICGTLRTNIQGPGSSSAVAA